MTENTAFGRPVDGEITHYTGGIKEQHDPSLFIEALDKLLAIEGVESVKWEQYTPYFNDGEACEFWTHDARVKVSWSEGEDGEYEDGFLTSYDLYEYENGDWRKSKTFSVNGHDTEELYNALSDFNGVLSNGHHYVILNEKFGDPAEVIATKEGFAVEYYDHE